MFTTATRVPGRPEAAICGDGGAVGWVAFTVRTGLPPGCWAATQPPQIPYPPARANTAATHARDFFTTIDSFVGSASFRDAGRCGRALPVRGRSAACTANC